MNSNTAPARTGRFPAWNATGAAPSADAVRMLPDTAGAVAVAVAGDVLMVVTDTEPGPAQFRQWEKLSGLNVSVSIASAEDYTQLRAAAHAQLPSASARLAPSLLADAETRDASDLLLRVGDVPRLRVAGALETAGRYPVLSAADLSETSTWLLGHDSGSGDCVQWGASRWRVHRATSDGNLTLSAHRIPAAARRLEELGLPASVIELTQARSGLILVAGSAGSGRTSTAASLVDRINNTRPVHVVTLEDVIEIRHTPRLAAITHMLVGPARDAEDYSTAAAYAAGHDADVLVMGRIDAAAALNAAMAAAEAGRLVIGVLEATSVSAALERAIGLYPDGQQNAARNRLAGTLSALIAQQLVPATGTNTRQLAAEILIATAAARTLLRTGRLSELPALLESATVEGMSSMDRSLALYAAAGRIDLDVARRHSIDSGRFDLLLAASATGTRAAAEPAGRHSSGALSMD